MLLFADAGGVFVRRSALVSDKDGDAQVDGVQDPDRDQRQHASECKEAQRSL